jgi:hypothetical protein
MKFFCAGLRSRKAEGKSAQRIPADPIALNSLVRAARPAQKK